MNVFFCGLDIGKYYAGVVVGSEGGTWAVGVVCNTFVDDFEAAGVVVDWNLPQERSEKRADNTYGKGGFCILRRVIK